MLPDATTSDSYSSPFPPLVPSLPTHPGLEPRQGPSASSPQQLVPPFSTTIFRHSPQLPLTILHGDLPLLSSMALLPSCNNGPSSLARAGVWHSRIFAGFGGYRMGELGSFKLSSSNSCVGSPSPFSSNLKHNATRTVSSPCCIG